MTLFPMFLKLEGRSCLVVGAGAIGGPKIESLLTAGASVRVIAPRVTAAVAEWSRTGALVWEAREFHPADLDGVFLVIAATHSREANGTIFGEAQQRKILCNVVDDPEYCDFYYPAVVRRGDLQIAISTNGQSPSLAQNLRQQLERQFGPGYARWVAELGETRRHVLASDLDPQRKRELLHSLASREALDAALAEEAKKDESAKRNRSVMV